MLVAEYHHAVRLAVGALDSLTPQLVSAITIGELRFGLALPRPAGKPLAHIEFRLEKAEEHRLAEIGRYTAEAFAHVKSSVALQRVDIHRRVPRWVEALGPFAPPARLCKLTRTISG